MVLARPLATLAAHQEPHPMDPRTLIASRIDLQLRRHLDHGVDVYRALADERYARDMLLVCDAMQGTPLPLLARQFRVAAERMQQERQRPGHDAGPPQDWATDTSGFGLSQLPAAADAPARKPERPWFSPSRWFDA
jgi:hypothetical protein